MNVLEIDNLNVTFNDYTALKDITFSIKKGTFLNIIGPNGSGKTTLIEVLAKLIKPTEGSFVLNSNNIGYVPQKLNSQINFPITVLEVITSGLNKNQKKDSIVLIDSWLEKMKLSEYKYENMSILSGGQQQRVYIIRALISKPDFLILDEPTSALDIEFRNEFYTLLKDIQNKTNLTIINVTHDINFFDFNNNYVLSIDREVKFFGTYKEFIKRGELHV